MVALLRHYGEGPVSVKHISEREKISTDYIEQLFIKLKRCGLIKVVRGPKGGFLLARQPSEIKLSDIIECVGESVELAPCSEIKSSGDRCELDDRCVTKAFFQKITDTIKEMLSSTSLADLYEGIWKNQKEVK